MVLWPVGHGCCTLCKDMARCVDEGRRVTSDVMGSWGPRWRVGCVVHSGDCVNAVQEDLLSKRGSNKFPCHLPGW